MSLAVSFLNELSPTDELIYASVNEKESRWSDVEEYDPPFCRHVHRRISHNSHNKWLPKRAEPHSWAWLENAGGDTRCELFANAVRFSVSADHREFHSKR